MSHTICPLFDESNLDWRDYSSRKVNCFINGNEWTSDISAAVLTRTGESIYIQQPLVRPT